MRRSIAGLLLFGAILFCGVGNARPVYASATYEGIAAIEVIDESEYSEDSSAESTQSGEGDSAEEEGEEVLGTHRDNSDKFILGLEIAISLTFAVGLIAAGRGAVSVESDESKDNNKKV